MGLGREEDRTCSVFPPRGFRAKGGPEIRREEVNPSGPYEGTDQIRVEIHAKSRASWGYDSNGAKSNAKVSWT